MKEKIGENGQDEEPKQDKATQENMNNESENETYRSSPSHCACIIMLCTEAACICSSQ